MSNRVSNKLDFSGFVLDETMGMALRYAQILLFAKDRYPGTFIPKTLIYKMAHRCTDLPAKDSRVVRNMSSTMSRVARLLAEKLYGELVICADGCYRLAVTYEERITKALSKAVQHYKIQTERFVHTIINDL